MTLQPRDSPEDWAVARRLVEEYARSLPVDLGFQDFQRELVSLPSDYGPPQGHFVLATQDEALIGCGGLRRVSDSVCEMKRLYVVPTHRGHHVGRAIAEALIADARGVGYQTIVLDTLPFMSRARALYVALGFTPTLAYRHNPIPGATFWQWTCRRMGSGHMDRRARRATATRTARMAELTRAEGRVGV